MADVQREESVMMQRYALRGLGSAGHIRPDKNGKWCKHDDHLLAIDAAVRDERQACVATIKGVIENVEFAERERIKADVKVLDDLLYKVTEALLEMAKMYGGKHEKDCPQDDTCDCHYAAFNKMVNDAAKAARDHFHEIGRKGPSLQ